MLVEFTLPYGSISAPPMKAIILFSSCSHSFVSNPMNAFPAPCQVTVHPVGACGQNENQKGQQGRAGGLRPHQEKHQHRGEQKAAASDEVGDGQNFPMRFHCTVTSCFTLMELVLSGVALFCAFWAMTAAAAGGRASAAVPSAPLR